MPNILKYSANLYKDFREAESRRLQVNVKSNTTIKSFSVLTISDNRSEAHILCDSARKVGEPCEVRKDSDSKCTVTIAESSKLAILEDVAQHPWVLWIEEQHKKKLRNKFSSGIVQSSDWSNGTSRYVWDHGLKGEEEIIGACYRMRLTISAAPPRHGARAI